MATDEHEGLAGASRLAPGSAIGLPQGPEVGELAHQGMLKTSPSLHAALGSTNLFEPRVISVQFAAVFICFHVF